jgi:hypothetical protein
MAPATCEHGRLLDVDLLRGSVACEDCEEQEWTRARIPTLIGTALLVSVIMIPAILILLGTFW